MSKIFSKNQGPAVDVNRNTFDLSFASHVTGKIGDLIPVYCQEVIPGDSFEIDPKFGLRFNPTVFPIQTKMHGIMHFFYVRNRNLMTKWPEYISRTDDDVVMPYLDITEENAKDIIGTGTIGDYLGVPTTVTGDFAQYLNLRLNTTVPAAEIPNSGLRRRNEGSVTRFTGTALELVNGRSSVYLSLPFASSQTVLDPLSVGATRLIDEWNNGVHHLVYDATYESLPDDVPIYMYGYWSSTKVDSMIDGSKDIVLNGPVNSVDDELNDYVYIVIAAGHNTDSSLEASCVYTYVPVRLQKNEGSGLCISSTYTTMIADLVNPLLGTSSVYLGLFFDVEQSATTSGYCSLPSVLPTDASYSRVASDLVVPAQTLTVRDATSDSAVAFNPFVKHSGETTPKVKLNALPFRAYESIYNYFYRDETVDPFVKDGKEVYNDFITTHADGADSTPYHLFQRNWERDYYTSCQVSPQQGNAPLVGISASGTFTFDDGTNEYTAQATIGDDGETITGISTYSPDMPKGSLRQLMDVVTNGISINDLRNVNSLQRWLETNIRRGYKYVDQIYSHFGVNPAFKANDCPEFIGGIHATGDVNQINDTTSDNLGQYGGQLSMFGGSDNKIRTYCDEHGYIIGIMCVFPEPTYSQMLPKHFLKTVTPLDYYFPEFSHIGMQPITYNEVTPIEVAASDAANSTDTINDVFGYQRAWADYLANNDQVHGDFRTTMSEYVVSRVFNDKPELGHEFIAIDHEDVDDIFVVTDGSDKLLGELRFDVKAKRPIPMYGIPRIE